MTARDKILSLLAGNPLLTTAQLVAETGVSRQRVHQVLKDEGLKAAPPPPVPRVIPSSGVGAGIGAVSHSACGMIGELLAACDLLARGWRVFSPVVRHSKIDLIATSPDGSIVKRFEVRSGRRKEGRLEFTRRPGDVCDHYAVVTHGEAVHYVPAIVSYK